MEQQFRWRKADETVEFHCCPDHSEKEIYFARLYTPYKGFKYSPTNDLVYGFKVGPKKPPKQLYFRAKAIDVFAKEVSLFLTSPPLGEEKHLLIPMPSSKLKASPDHDDRVDLVVEKIRKLCDNVKYFPVLTRTIELEASHNSKATRNVRNVYQSLGIDEEVAAGFSNGNILTVLDDVTTSGASFEAARLMLSERFSGCRIIGIFWAKSQTAAGDDVPTA